MKRDRMRLGWILVSVILLALLAASIQTAVDDLADEFSVVNESDPIEWNNKGVALYNQGKYDEALICFDKALEIDPNFVKAWNGKGVTLHVLGKYDEALICFDKALEIDPKYAYAWNGKGNTLYGLGRYDAALICFDKALEIDSNFANAWNDKGNALNRLGNYDEALICFDKALKINPTLAYAWNGKGNAFHGLGDYDDALICFHKALEIDPKYTYAWNGKGNTLNRLGNYEEALIYFDKTLEIDPNYVSAFNGKGNAFYGLDRYDDALICFDKAIEIDQKYAYAWNGKGNALQGLGRNNEALICFDKALKIDSKLAQAWNGKGSIFYGLGRNDEALIYFDKALEVDPKLAQAWNGKGSAIYGLGRIDEALICFDKALEIDPKYSYAWNGKGVVFCSLNRTEEAIELYNKALQLDPRIPIFWYNKGNALEIVNRSVEAAMAYSLGRERELNSETKIGIFAVFLVIYSALAAGGYTLSRRFRKYTTSIVILSINLLGFWAIMWILSGFFDLLLVVQFFVGGILMTAISAVLWSISGFPTNPWMDQLGLEIEDFNRKCQRFSWLIRAVGIPAALLFASIAVVFYFRFYLITEISMVDFLKFAFVSIFLLGLFVTLPPIWSAMISKNLDGRTREFLLIFQFGHLGFSGLYSGLILWILGKGSFGHSVSLGDIKFPISIHSLEIVMFLFVLAIIIPYVSGSKRASRWKMALFDKERRWLDELLEVLDYPTPSLYVPKFRKVLNDIKDDNTISCQEDKFDRIKSIYGAEALRLNPHFRYRDFLMKLQEKIAEMISQFEELDDNEENLKEKARIYADAYRLRRNEIVEMIEREGQFKPKFWIALAIILTPVLGQILASMINLILKTMIDTNLGGLITSTPTLPLP